MPIVSPLSIYLIMTVDSMSYSMSVVAFILMIAALISAISTDADYKMSKEEKSVKFKKAIKKSYIAIAICILTALIPSKETLVMMTATKYVTTENVQISKEIIGKVYNDILEIIKTK